MDIKLTKEDLIKFEHDIAECFNNKQIRAPIHLSYDNEEQLISIFKEVQEEDWICTSWRSHYHCLLKSVPPDRLKQDILDGRSIELCYKDYNIFSSAIVAGNISIAVGLSMDIKRKGQKNKVWCFVGDMSSLTGQFQEAYEYSINNKLPITFVIEDNGLSVCSDTLKTWGYFKHPWGDDEDEMADENGIVKWSKWVYYYKYDLHQKYKHSGTNIRIVF